MHCERRIFCKLPPFTKKKREGKREYPKGEGVRNTTSNKQTNAPGLMKPRKLGTPLGN